jgi:prepilin-type N-terminal cleavage/methylation domain-containing protein
MKQRGGFTLIEIMVVMALIAVLTVLSGGFLKDLYDNYRAAQIADEIVGYIREAQSKAMGVVGDKAYGVEVLPKSISENGVNTLKIISYTASTPAGSLAPTVVSSINLGASVISLDRTGVVNGVSSRGYGSAPALDTLNSSGKSFVFNFSSPFGNPNFLYRDSAVTSPSVNYCNDSTTAIVTTSSLDMCMWRQNSNFMHNFSLFHAGNNVAKTALAGEITTNGANAFYTQQGGQALINVEFGKSSRKIVVKGTGEAYVE